MGRRPALDTLTEQLVRSQAESESAEETLDGLESLIDGMVTPTNLITSYREAVRSGRRTLRDLRNRIQAIADFNAARQHSTDSEP